MIKSKQAAPNPSDWVGKSVTVIIDRPLGSRHPAHGFLYPLNYGYVPGVMGADGEELDAYVLGPSEPVQTFTGICIAIIHRQDDDDDKLVLASPGAVYSDGQILALTRFQEQYFQVEVWR